MFYPGADFVGRMHLTVIAAAFLCTAPFVLASMPRGVLAFAGPLLAGSLSALIIAGPTDHWFEISLLIVYSFVFPFGLRQHARVFRERVQALIRLDEKNQWIRLFLNDFETNSTDWLWRTDNGHRIVMLSPTFEMRAGLAPQMIADLSIAEFVRRFVTTDPHKAEISIKTFQSGKAFRDVVVRVTIEGKTRWWELSGTPNTSHSGAFLGFHGIGRDVTARIDAERQLRHFAHHDALTGGKNRAAFRASLDAAARRSAEGVSNTVVLIDLDRFKQVNDTAGHAVGDEVLREAFRRLQMAMPNGATVARVGGDEFAAIVPNVPVASAVRAAERAIAAISMPIVLPSGQFSIGASSGVAAMPDMGCDPSTILRLADAALYGAKEAGKGGVQIATNRQVEALAFRARLNADLVAAIANGAFHLEYQPVVDAAGQTVALEAFMRWNHNELGSIKPREFLALAEQSGAFEALGRFAIETACSLAATLPDRISISVNLSARQFLSAELRRFVVGCLARHRLRSGRLELEIGEAVMAVPEGAAAVAEFRNAGVAVVLDDFGAGSSSFTTLCDAPFSKVKIDRELVSRVDNDEKARKSVQGILALGQSLGLQVSAEGVETAQTAQFLRESACPVMQGFYFAAPMPAADLPAWLLANTVAKPESSLAAA
ncbi:MAG: EAL domain-containing protein [Phyllobacteriaceae bacterium]|nr:EAL domain-containing protein [Phyllobacteriaceae bacterium]